MKEFDHFLKQICPGLNLNWRKYRRKGARRRVQARMRQLGLSGFNGYAGYLADHSDEAERLPELMLVTVTRFFRDRNCWDGLVHTVLPKLLQRFDDPCLRILSAGSCGGEEPYSLAMAWRMELEKIHPGRSLIIFGYDLDPAGLERAREGLYHPSTMRELPGPYQERWFAKQNGTHAIDPAIKEMVHFKPADLTRSSLPTGLHLILCRYLFFTYFKGKRRRRILERFWSALPPGGGLMVGAKETLLPSEHDLFTPWPGAECVYERGGRKVQGER